VTATAKDELILEIWAGLDHGSDGDSAGAAELELIQKQLLEKSNVPVPESPASIARTLADHGVRLRHPEVLEADLRWREQASLFASEELNFPNVEAAFAFVEKLAAIPQGSQLRSFVVQLKVELESVAKSMRVALPDRLIAIEVAHWLTVWLQNPAIFADWLALRRESTEFRERFG
jgi:hypothetical protein